MIDSFKRKSWFTALLILGIFLLIYWRTCCPTIFWWDSAEFVTVIATLGIPHPPSFPLYILLGKVFSFLPFFSLSFRLNLLSGLFSALSMAIIFLLFLKIIKTFFADSSKYGKLLVFSALLLPLIAGLNYAFWIQGVRAEVYSLNGLIFMLMFFCGINFSCESRSGPSENGNRQASLRWICLFFFISGLGMGNHNVTLISLFPAFLFLFMSYDLHNILRLKHLAIFLLLFLLGCSIYLYLPLRAVNSPALNWGNPVRLESILTAALALKSVKQIGFALNHTLIERTKDAWQMIYSQFTFLPFLLSLIGVLSLLRKELKLFLFFLLLITANSLTIIVLPSEFISTSSDFQGYILPAIFSIALLCGFGILFILNKVVEWTKEREFSLIFRKSLVIIFCSFFFSISLLPFLTFSRLVDLSENDLAYRYGKGVLSRVKENGVLFIDNPNLYFVLSALREGKGYRKDVAVLDRGLLRAEWYCQQERKKYPKHFSGVHSGLRGEDLFLTLLSRGLSRNIPVYMEFTQRDSDLVGFLLPAGYLFEVGKKVINKLPDELLTKQGEFETKYLFKKEESSFQNDLDAQRMFVFITYRWGLYYEQRGMLKEALKNFSLAGELDPYNPGLQRRIERLRNRIQLAKF